VGDYNGRTPLDIAVDLGRGRLEIGDHDKKSRGRGEGGLSSEVLCRPTDIYYWRAGKTHFSNYCRVSLLLSMHLPPFTPNAVLETISKKNHSSLKYPVSSSTTVVTTLVVVVVVVVLVVGGVVAVVLVAVVVVVFVVVVFSCRRGCCCCYSYCCCCCCCCCYCCCCCRCDRRSCCCCRRCFCGGGF
jgi:hypothetical protein